METPETTEQLEPKEKPLELRDKLARDLKSAEEQLARVVKQLAEVRQAEQQLLQQQIALQALASYLKNSIL